MLGDMTETDTRTEFLSLQEVAQKLGVTEKALYHWRYGGVGPPSYRIGGRIKYRIDELEEWIKAQRSQGAAR